MFYANMSQGQEILNSTLNYALVLIFYVIILKMKNFWNTIMFDKIENILADMKKAKTSQSSEFDNLVIHLEKYKARIARYNCQKWFIVIALCSIELLLVLLQIGFILLPYGQSTGVRISISALGIILFIFDLYFCQLYAKLVYRFVNIMWPNSILTRAFLISILAVYIIMMLMRAISEDLIKMGSYLLEKYVRGGQSGFNYFCTNQGATAVEAQKTFKVVQSVFPNFVALNIILIFFFFGIKPIEII